MPVGCERLIEPSGASAQFGKGIKQKRVSGIDGNGMLHQLDTLRSVPRIIGNERSKVKGGRVLRLILEDLPAHSICFLEAAGLAPAIGGREDLRQGYSLACHV